MIPIVNTRSYEIVRDRIGQILGDELPSQATLHNDPNLNATVFINRVIPINDEETPIVNVIMPSGSWDNFTREKQDGTYIYNIDIYVGSAASSTETGDVLALAKLQKLSGVVQGILMHGTYNTLKFAKPFIERREVRSISIGQPSESLTANNTMLARLEMSVRVAENSVAETPPDIAGYSTQVKLGLTDKGFIYSGEDIPVPPPICEPVTVTDSDQTTIVEVPSGGNFTCTPVEQIPDSLYNPTKSGKSVMVPGDDGDTQAGRNVDYLTLDFISPFGNTVRFTNDMGGAWNDNSDGSTPDYVIDNATRLGYQITHYFGMLSMAVSNASSLVVGAYNDFRVMNLQEFAPINNNGDGFRPYTVIFGDLTLWGFNCQWNSSNYIATASNGIPQAVNVANNRRFLNVRNHVY